MNSAAITPYEGQKPYIFISYAHDDAAQVFPILEKMDAAGYRIWYDDGIAPGSEWPENIADHLNRCQVFLAFISNASMESSNCRREVNYALSKDKNFLGILLEKTNMSPGMEMQLSSQQSILRYNYRTEEDFLKKILGSAILSTCQEPVADRDTDNVSVQKKGILWIVILAAVLCLIAAGAILLPHLYGPEETAAETKPVETTPAKTDETASLEEKGAIWVANGLFRLADGTQNAWSEKTNALYEASALTAIDLSDVKQIDADLYTILSEKDIRYLYKIDLLVGTYYADWDVYFMRNGQLGSANVSYAFKIAKCTKSGGLYKESQWIPNPKDANAECLTPSTLFIPVWQEKADENGFSWSDNPVVTGGAGLYTLVIAQYNNSSSAGKPGYGIGLVLKEKRTGVSYKGITEFDPAGHTFGVCGSFESSNWGTKGSDIMMTASEDGTWTAEVKLKAGDSFKVRADGSWIFSWGDNERNYTVDKAGTYIIVLRFKDGIGIVTAKLKP